MERPELIAERVDGCELEYPKYESKGAACFDLRAYLADFEALVVEYDDNALKLEYVDNDERISEITENLLVLSCGFRFDIPDGWEMAIRSRTGLASEGLCVANQPGTVDCDYTGVVKVMLTMLFANTITIENGDRIAQAKLQRAPQANLVRGEVTKETERGDGMFGSTGRK